MINLNLFKPYSCGGLTRCAQTSRHPCRRVEASCLCNQLNAYGSGDVLEVQKAEERGSTGDGVVMLF